VIGNGPVVRSWVVVTSTPLSDAASTVVPDPTGYVLTVSARSRTVRM
jgi:hypothetical protein